jgi:hypothetical protein
VQLERTTTPIGENSMSILVRVGVALCIIANASVLRADEFKFEEIIPARIMTLPVKENPTLCFPQQPANTFVIGDRINLQELKHYPDRKLWLVEGLSVFVIRGKAGYCDEVGKIVIPPTFERANNFHHGLAVVQLAGKYGYIDRTGRFVIKAKYDRAENFNENRAVVELDNKYGYIDRQGKLVIEAKYSSAGVFSNGRAIVRHDDQFGILGIDGTWITLPVYKDVYRFGGSIIATTFDDQLGMIDEHGNVDFENFSSKYDAIIEELSKAKAGN